MKIKDSIKDFQVAREMFGSNTKEQCHLAKKLRDKGIVTPHCEGWSIIHLPIGEDGFEDCGWLIPNEALED